MLFWVFQIQLLSKNPQLVNREICHPTCQLCWLLDSLFPVTGTLCKWILTFWNLKPIPVKKKNIAFKTNTWEKHSLLVLRGLIDSINFLWQIRPECSNKKRTCGFSSGVYSPPHESEQNRKLYKIYNELIQQHICFSSLLAQPREHTHTHTHAHTRNSSLHWLKSKLIYLELMLLEELHQKLHAGLQVKLLCWLLLLLFCIGAKFILCFEYTHKVLWAYK